MDVPRKSSVLLPLFKEHLNNLAFRRRCTCMMELYANNVGVEDVAVKSGTNTVMVKGNKIDASKLCDIVRKKSGRNNVQLVSPSPQPDQQQPQAAVTDDDNPSNKDQENDKLKPPPVETVVLKVQMHCEACAHILRKHIRKIQGVKSVETDVGKDQVRISGVIANPASLVEFVYKKIRKHADIIAVNDHVDDKKVQKDDGDGNKNDNKSDEIKEQTDNGDIGMAINQMINRYNDYNYWVPLTRTNNNYMEYNNNSLNYQHPFVFGDENPNACFIM